MYKTFKDLDFKAHRMGTGYHAIEDFPNGYSVSVVGGPHFYGDGINTFELAVMHNGQIDYSTEITSDVIGYQTRDEITAIMVRVQNLPKKEN